MTPPLDIVDAHQHFWDLAGDRHPWLAEAAMIPFRYGDYAVLKRDYLPADYRADSGAHRVVATVHVEAEWDPGDPIGETRWLAAVRGPTGPPGVPAAPRRLHPRGPPRWPAGQAPLPFVAGSPPNP